MTTPSKDISKYDLTDTQSAVSPAYAGGLFDAKLAAASIAAAGQIRWDTFTEYTTPGTYSVTVPQDCDRVFIFAMTGGGGGAGGRPTSWTPYVMGQQLNIMPRRCGQSSEIKRDILANVTPGSSISIVVGAAGTNTEALDTQGGTGGKTLFGDVASTNGGAGAAASPGCFAVLISSVKWGFSHESNDPNYTRSKMFPYGNCAILAESASGSSASSLRFGSIFQNATGGYIAFAFIKKETPTQ